VIQVNPNRMELLKLKKKQQVAVRGHKLLKDKLEGLLKDFMEFIKEYKRLRTEVDSRIQDLFRNFAFASSTIQPAAYKAALAYGDCRANLDVSEKVIMNVKVPSFAFSIEGNFLSYGFLDTGTELDEAMARLKDVIENMVRLAEMEKTIELVAEEIERTRRRVNALEYVMIPQLADAIKSVSGKLDEMERGNITRLMKIKQLLGM